MCTLYGELVGNVYFQSDAPRDYSRFFLNAEVNGSPCQERGEVGKILVETACCNKDFYLVKRLALLAVNSTFADVGRGAGGAG
jgi:hypothetical protein